MSCGIGFIILVKSILSNTSTLSWQEVPLPTQYLDSHGIPEIVSIGQRFGHGIAISSNRGLCILDLCPKENRAVHPISKGSPNMTLQRMGKHLRMPSFKKWNSFANEAIASSFRVHAFKWWEHVGKFGNDLVLASVEEIRSNRYKLVCWSREG